MDLEELLLSLENTKFPDEVSASTASRGNDRWSRAPGFESEIANIKVESAPPQDTELHYASEVQPSEDVEEEERIRNLKEEQKRMTQLLDEVSSDPNFQEQSYPDETQHVEQAYENYGDKEKHDDLSNDDLLDLLQAELNSPPPQQQQEYTPEVTDSYASLDNSFLPDIPPPSFEQQQTEVQDNYAVSSEFLPPPEPVFDYQTQTQDPYAQDFSVTDTPYNQDNELLRIQEEERRYQEAENLRVQREEQNKQNSERLEKERIQRLVEEERIRKLEEDERRKKATEEQKKFRVQNEEKFKKAQENEDKLKAQLERRRKQIEEEEKKIGENEKKSNQVSAPPPVSTVKSVPIVPSSKKPGQSKPAATPQPSQPIVQPPVSQPKKPAQFKPSPTPQPYQTQTQPPYNPPSVQPSYNSGPQYSPTPYNPTPQPYHTQTPAPYVPPAAPAPAYNPTPVPPSAKVCASCGQVIATQITMVDDRYYHPNCFVCQNCHNPVLGGFLMRNGTPICESCIARTRGPCFKCGQPLTGETVTYDGNKYHYNCHACTVCNNALGYEGFYEVANELRCGNCVSVRR